MVKPMPLDQPVSKTLTEVILTCQKCGLSENTTPIPQIGSYDKEIMIVGEAPGEEEEKFREPFVGRSGELLNSMLHSIQVDRTDCFITNVVKCRPTIRQNGKIFNRTPEYDEMKKCFPFLKKQIEILNPKIIIILGRLSLQAIKAIYRINANSITKAQGNIYIIRKNLIVLPMYHPAYILRNYSYKKTYQDFFLQLKPYIKEFKIKTSRQTEELSKWF
jgi:DNA polymerase